LSRLLERVERWNPRLYCTDDWAAYAELIPQGRLYVGKDQTHGIERDHSRQRHWLARFRRRTCVIGGDAEGCVCIGRFESSRAAGRVAGSS
jgi:IS1 family transposase